MKIDGQTVQVAGLKEPLELKAGEHGLVVTSGEFQAVTQSFVVRRGMAEVVRVSLLPKADSRPGSKTPSVQQLPEKAARPVPAGDGSIATHGLGGFDKIAPAAFPPAWRVDRDFARISCPGEMAFSKVSACRYVLETELTIGNPQNGRIAYQIDDPGHGTELSLGLSWPQDRTATAVPCRLFRHQPFGVNWSGERQFPIGQRLAFKLIAADADKVLFCNGERLALTWQALRWISR